MPSFIAMNHFRVDPARGAEFEELWRKRETWLAEVPGFVRFALLRGGEPGAYASHTTWASREAFSWSSARRAGPLRSATRPAAARPPTCRMPPPNIFLTLRASRMRSRRPQRIEPQWYRPPAVG